jgi:hypothetical protein
MPKKKKPFITVEADCPNCKSKLRIAITRTRTNQPETATFDTTTDVEVIKQTELFPRPGKKPTVKGKGKKAELVSPKP